MLLQDSTIANGSQKNRGQVVLLTCEKQGQCNHMNEWQDGVATKKGWCMEIHGSGKENAVPLDTEQMDSQRIFHKLYQ